ncbi:hypothetical protein AB0M02_04260 [Actinoplanes sp. NPDC051861]|uniref:hypothetical protein n=1 Tax=Actinoplanes sp. NPDC051861 TaxID=3155170 RepID=UPI00343CAF47
MKKTPRFSRIAAALAGAVLGLVAFATPAAAHGKEYLFTHTFKIENGQAIATITPNKDLPAAEEVTLVSYFAPRPEYSVPQYLFDSEIGTLKDKDGVVTLTVDVPDCNTQVDLFFGGKDDIIDPFDGKSMYGDKKLGEKTGLGGRSKGPQAWFNGGTKACAQPAVQAVAACDGSVDVQLSNNGKLSKYDVEFRVKATGLDKKVKVAPGKGDTVHVPAGAGKITVSAPGMADFTYTWARPDNCVPAAAGENDCTNVTVTVTNPEGNTPAKAEVTYGSETKTTTVAGGSSQLVTFPAGEATTATVKYPEIAGSETVTVQIKKADCPAPTTPSTTAPTTTPTDNPTTTPPTTTPEETPSETASETPDVPVTTEPADEDGELALTGAAAGTVAGGAALLLVVGLGLFFMARRRKVNFKA